MPTIQFYPIDVTYKTFNNRAVVYMFGRTTDNQQVCVIDENFRPYFWAIPENDSQTIAKVISDFSVDSKKGVAKVTDIEIVEKRFYSKTVSALKIFTEQPWQVPIIAKELKNIGGIKSVHEFDIKFVRRYLIDKEITPLTLTESSGLFINPSYKVLTFKADSVKQISDQTYKNLKILAFDIETYNPTGKSLRPELYPIIMHGLYGEDFKKVFTWKRFKSELSYIEFLDSEAELIEKFKETIESFRPDILVGYFSSGFDFPYIIKRAEKYKIKLDINLDNSEVQRSNTNVETTGFVHLDIFNFIRRSLRNYLETDSFSLDEVSKELLGEKKHKINMNDLAPAWDTVSEQLECFASYNLQDARLTYKLCEKLLPNLEEFVKLTGLPLYDLTNMGFSRLVEWYLLRQAFQYNELAPNPPSYAETKERLGYRFKGAFVFEPKPGLYKNIVVYDFRSLYPSIIVSHNLGPGMLKCDCCPENIVPIDDAKIWFCKNKKGFIPTVIENIITRRLRIKEMLKETEDKDQKILLKARSEALKLLSNSFYGYLGFYGARWYSSESARSTTAYGRYYIKDVIAKAESAGFGVIYSDTDSVFLTLGDKTTEDSKTFARSVNQNLPGLMELEFEGYYPAGIFVSAKVGQFGAKKKYALIDKNGLMKIRGFETVRRNWSPIAKQVQRHVLDIILKEDDVTKAFNYVKSIIAELRKKIVDVKDVTMSTQLTKDIADYDSITPHVAAASLMEKAGYDIGPGSIVTYIVTEGKGIIRERVKLPEDVKQNEYDAEYYINNQVMPAIDRIFDVLGIDIKKLLEDKDQSRLSSFF